MDAQMNFKIPSSLFIAPPKSVCKKALNTTSRLWGPKVPSSTKRNTLPWNSKGPGFRSKKKEAPTSGLRSYKVKTKRKEKGL